jgi:hypothetical protein
MPEDEGLKAAGGSSFYADVVRVNYSPYTFLLEFGLVRPEGPIDELGSVRLSPHTAAIMARIMSSQVKKYETDHAPITLSEEVLRQSGLEVGPE